MVNSTITLLIITEKSENCLGRVIYRVDYNLETTDSRKLVYAHLKQNLMTLNQCQQLPAPYKQLVSGIKMDKQ